MRKILKNPQTINKCVLEEEQQNLFGKIHIRSSIEDHKMITERESIIRVDVHFLISLDLKNKYKFYVS